MTLADLTDKQLYRLSRKVRRRIEMRLAGGLTFGWDMPTLWAVAPGLATLAILLQAEGKRRHDIARRNLI